METIALPEDHQPTRADLEKFLGACREAAVEDGHGKLASMTLRCGHLDPLAVLASIYEADEFHFYLEQPQSQLALAGAEAVQLGQWSGPERFAQARAWVEEVLEHTIAAGAMEAPHAGPHFFGGATFAAEADEPAPPFAPLTLFVPRWQVARQEGSFTAVANCWVEPESDLSALVEKIWAAYQKFNAFDYSAAPPLGARQLVSRQVVGGEGHYPAAVTQALAGIAAGRYEKIVLADALDLTFDQPIYPLETLNNLRAAYPSCWAFSLENAAGQSWIGATPERLLAVQHGQLTTEAIAGSCARGATLAADAALARTLLQSEKDLREHQHVIDSIQRRLASLGIEADPVGPPQLLPLANVQHLHTPMRAALPEGLHLLEVAAVLHPTPAVGGTPRAAAVAEIATLEAFPRGLYAGLVGWFDHRGDGALAVAIRSAFVQGAQARLFAGAGIVAGSDSRAEHRETQCKMQALLQAMLAHESRPGF